MNPGTFLKRVFKETGHKTIDEKTYQELESDQREMIMSVVELSKTTVKEVMVPRIDTVFIDIENEPDEILEKIIASGHSRFPVYQETIDNVIGILYVKDVLRCLVKDNPIVIKNLMRLPIFVPGSKHIDDLLSELRRRKVHIAVVVDEYGGVSGIVCMEDIIEEIIGDIQDEFDDEQEDIQKIDDVTYICDARINLEDLANELEIELPIEDFDTLGGFVFDLFGKIPSAHEKAEYNSHDFIIHGMDGHKINLVKIVLSREHET
ncbi:MAG: hemolysin family protein [Treponema sp.]|jgi:CBS domain containing-hemolysin-like protein|nr:hemolysin family protein [Treponema sp.]